MKLLHIISPVNLRPTKMWVTDELACPYCQNEQEDDEDGYRETEFDGHHHCANMWLNITDSSFCECDDCLMDNYYHYQTHDDITQGPSPFIIVCLDCSRGNHPTPPEDQ